MEKVQKSPKYCEDINLKGIIRMDTMGKNRVRSINNN